MGEYPALTRAPVSGGRLGPSSFQIEVSRLVVDEDLGANRDALVQINDVGILHADAS